MEVIRFLMELVKTAWNVISGIKIDGISITTIIVAFIIVFFIVGAFLHARR